MASDMEAEILKFICANKGAVDTEELIHLGLCDSATVTGIIRNHNKFATVCLKGQPKVVAKTRLRLCSDKDCKEESCKALHLCKNLIFNETCNFKGRCRFSHQLDSPHNQDLLRTHGLESLSRMELCTLLLQNDGSLLPPICCEYNKGDGVHGGCTSGDCKKLHVCRRLLHAPCHCPRAHEFTAPQAAKRLQEKRLPDHLIPNLKTAYVNKEALYKRSNQGRKAGAARGRGGQRGRRGNRGKGGERPAPQERASSAYSLLMEDDNDSGSDSDATTTSEMSSVVYDSDASSEAGLLGDRGSLAGSGDDSEPEEVAAPSLSLCRNKTCEGTCKALHLCKNFLFSGSCSFILRNGCTFSHALDSEHNLEILKEHHLEKLSREELCMRLLQSDDALLPQICHDYNNGDGVYGLCQRGDDCQRLHICERFLRGPCSCFRHHDFDFQQPMRVLHSRGVPDQLVSALRPVYLYKLDSRRAAHRAKNPGAPRGRGGNRGNRGNRGNQQPLLPRVPSPGGIFAANINNWAFYAAGAYNSPMQNPNQTPGAYRGLGRGGVHGNRGRGNSHQPQPRARATDGVPAAATAAAAQENRQRPVRDKTEICMYFIKGPCKHEDRCFKAHDKMPYRWQVRQDDQWNNLPDNESIEKDYCDPKKTRSTGSSPVDFDTMTTGTDKVRRLSTINSVVEPTFIHTTEWAWYWEDENARWNLYTSAINSTQLEESFVKNDQDVVEFTGTNKQLYSLSFADMIQTNKTYGTKRLVRRRPKFVSEEDVKTKRVRRPANMGFTGAPDHWDKTQIPQTGYKAVCLQESSDEYKEIESLFRKTMSGFTIRKISRIQNKDLWEVFQWKKNQMRKNKNGRAVDERKLFHGTEQKHVEDICGTNFDWRICGKNGTLYGKGSYFARDAKYSHNYTGNSEVRSMFIARVLIGTYTKGSSDVVRPEVNRHDSCVDDIRDPSIFVVFEQHQIYPEYLLEYRASSMLTSTFGVPSSSTGYQSGASGYLSSSSGVQSSSSGAQSSSSVYLSVSSGYLSSSSGYLSSSSGVQSSSSGVQSSSSGYRPSSSGVQSSSSGVQFSSPGYQSASARYSSSSSGVQPSSSAYRSSSLFGNTTSASASQSRSTQNSSTPSYNRTSPPGSRTSPPPVPKKAPDSCVIA